MLELLFYVFLNFRGFSAYKNALIWFIAINHEFCYHCK